MHPVAAATSSRVIRSAMRHSSRFARDLRGQFGSLLMTHPDIFRDNVLIRFRGEDQRLERALSYVVRGLYAKFYRAALPQHCVMRFKQLLLEELESKLDFFLGFIDQRPFILGDDVVQVCHRASTINPHESLWVLCFYRAVHFAIITRDPELP